MRVACATARRRVVIAGVLGVRLRDHRVVRQLDRQPGVEPTIRLTARHRDAGRSEVGRGCQAKAASGSGAGSFPCASQ
jgi:hypothetical protein